MKDYVTMYLACSLLAHLIGHLPIQLAPFFPIFTFSSTLSLQPYDDWSLSNPIVGQIPISRESVSRGW